MKKIVSILLGLSLMGSSGIMAAEQNSELEQVIQKVKAEITVPKTLTEFSYQKNGEVYDLNWTDGEGKIGYVNAQCEKDGDLLGYQTADYTDSYSILSKISYGDGEKVAIDFLNKMMPQYVPDLTKVEERIDDGQCYIYQYDYKHNDIPVWGKRATVYVNKQTGKIQNYRGFSMDGKTFKESGKILSLNEAGKVYADQVGVRLCYFITYQYSKKELITFPTYMINNWTHKMIDAETSKVFVCEDETEDYAKGGSAYDLYAEAAGSPAKNIDLTPQESAVVKEQKMLLSDEALLKNAEKYFKVLNEAKLKNHNLYKRDDLNTYVATFEMSKEDKENTTHYYVSMDAKSGKILSYTETYDNDLAMEKSTPEEREMVKKSVEKFLEEIEPEDYKKIQYDRGQDESAYFYKYERVEKGIPVNEDGFEVIYNKQLGRIVSYNCLWRNGEFEALKKTISMDEVLNAFEFKLVYAPWKDGQYILAYACEEDYAKINPYTGKKIDDNGQEIKKENKIPYTDIKGDANEKYITALYDSGIYLEGEKFNPRANITEQELLTLLLRMNGETIKDETLQEIALKREILEKDEVYTADKEMTREEVMTWIIKATSYRKLVTSEVDEIIFNCPYKDQDTIAKERKAAVALGYGLKIIDTPKEGKFNPTQKINKGEVCKWLYRLLQEDNLYIH